jgi:hypothetical protein
MGKGDTGERLAVATERIATALERLVTIVERVDASPKEPRRAVPKVRPTARAPVAHIRAWAKEQGYAVSDRARLPATVVAAYEQAHR